MESGVLVSHEPSDGAYLCKHADRCPRHGVRDHPGYDDPPGHRPGNCVGTAGLENLFVPKESGSLTLSDVGSILWKNFKNATIGLPERIGQDVADLFYWPATHPVETALLVVVGPNLLPVSLEAGTPATMGPGAATSLYRAVGPAELQNLVARSGAFWNPIGIEAKYFSTSAEGAASFARQAFGTGLYQGPYTIVETKIPTNLITPGMRVSVDKGISTVVVPTEILPALSPARALNFTPLP